MEQVKQTILKDLKDLKPNSLKDTAFRSLWNFANKQYNELRRVFGVDSSFLLLLLLVNNKNISEQKRMLAETKLQEFTELNMPNQFGVPMQKFAKEYINNNVKPVLARLAKENALDPDDFSGRNSLRNRAEMEVRYNNHLEQIEELKTAGNKLVIASSHSDCSERCSKWQGRVYSLDGTSGVTPDGRRFVPLEEATDIFYTTKAGKTYKNGLLGFNCRHYLIPYKNGLKEPKYSTAQEDRERAITTKQRQLERVVRENKTLALEFKGIDDSLYKKYRQLAINTNKRYIGFSKDNNRAFYPDRTKIL